MLKPFERVYKNVIKTKKHYDNYVSITKITAMDCSAKNLKYCFNAVVAAKNSLKLKINKIMINIYILNNK